MEFNFYLRQFAYLILVLCISNFNFVHSKDVFTEELLIKPLASGHVFTHFQFTTLVNINLEENLQHYRLFPKTLGDIIEKFDINELNFILTRGQWKHKQWGYPVVDAPPGAEVWAWFKEKTEDIDKTWFTLNNALSGLVCASLNFIDESNTIIPKVAFQPQGVINSSSGYKSSLYIRYSSLPNEIVCTENLTPWKKLLPCHVKSGLATLLNAAKLFNNHYHSLGIHVRKICEMKNGECTSVKLELSQTVSLVFESASFSGEKSDWSLKKLFGYGLFGHCPLATNSTIFVDVSDQNANLILNPAPHYTVSGFTQNELLAVYDLKLLFSPDLTVFNLAGSYKNNFEFSYVRPPPIYANRYITGFGKDTGGITCKIYNTNPSKSISVAYMEYIPWFVQVFFHTLEVKHKETSIKPDYIHIVPGDGKKQPSHFELIFTLPPKSEVEVSFQFQRTYMTWTEHPPDANHGFYIGSSVISTVFESAQNYTGTPIMSATISSKINSTAKQFFVRIHTDMLLVSLPTPDFSMPYNVICLVCTLVALAFGPLHNITTKKLTAVSADEPSSLSKIIKKLKEKIARKNKPKSE